MFTGLIEACVRVRNLRSVGTGAELRLPTPSLAPDLPPWEPKLGESIAICGCCLTVTAVEPDGDLLFDLSSETLGITWLGELEPERQVNLERSVRLSDRLGGHMVSGHVDALGRISAIAETGDGGKCFTFEVAPGFERYLVPKGSVTVDGISLTVVDPRERLFDVAIIPETLERTNLGTAIVDQHVHLEADMIGKWVERLLAFR